MVLPVHDACRPAPCWCPGARVHAVLVLLPNTFFLHLQTVKFKKEIERNITIKLGYANAKIYRCPSAPRLGSYA